MASAPLATSLAVPASWLTGELFRGADAAGCVAARTRATGLARRKGVGGAVGTPDGTVVGTPLGAALGAALGADLGRLDLVPVGCGTGRCDGALLGGETGRCDGALLGGETGRCDGATDGSGTVAATVCACASAGPALKAAAPRATEIATPASVVRVLFTDTSPYCT